MFFKKELLSSTISNRNAKWITDLNVKGKLVELQKIKKKSPHDFSNENFLNLS